MIRNRILNFRLTFANEFLQLIIVIYAKKVFVYLTKIYLQCRQHIPTLKTTINNFIFSTANSLEPLMIHSYFDCYHKQIWPTDVFLSLGLI